jgi:hypothetical protein
MTHYYPNRLPDEETPVVIRLAEELKNVPFNMTPHGAYSVARHAVAQLLSPAAAGYPSTVERAPVEDGCQVSDEQRLIGELRAEIAALKAAAALTANQRLTRACICMMSAAKRLRSSENNDNLGDRLEREAKFLSSGLAADPDGARQAVYDAVAAGLSGTYYCSRTWSAWRVNTMTEQDFTPAGDVSEVVGEITDATMAALGY